VFTGWSKAAEAVLSSGLVGAILSVSLRVDGGADLLGKLVADSGNGTLYLIQKTA
jgi:hypothetical protein